MVARNFGNAAELDLVRRELAHRNSDGARRLLAGVEQRITALTEAEPALAKPEIADSEPAIPGHPQMRQWTDQAVARLRARLIDLSRKSPLIAFKHTSRSASQLRFVDERPDLLFEHLSASSLGFEPLPGEEQTPADLHVHHDDFAIDLGREQIGRGRYGVGKRNHGAVALCASSFMATSF